MSLQELSQLVAPPPKPSEVGTAAQWQEVERELGLKLPPDYRDFVFTYGSGSFAAFYLVYNPFAASPYVALLPSVERVCGYEREFKCSWPDRVPYPIYPEQPGLLPWGNDENGNSYYWLTQGPPESWPVLSCEVRGEGYREHGCTMTEYLTKVLLGEIRPLASDYPTAEHRVFESWHPEPR